MSTEQRSRAQRRGRGPWPLGRWSVLSALVGVAALAALAAIGGPLPSAQAAAAGGTNQITGTGTTSSAITVKWTSGLLGANNKPLPTEPGQLAPNADRASANPTGPTAFMYQDFKNLSVTVSQTQDLVHQGIQLNWTGGVPTQQPFAGQFLQVMQCYGDSNSGPDPEDCEYGSPGLGPPGFVNAGIADRDGDLCVPGAIAGTTSPAVPAGGGPTSEGCDPNEPTDLDKADVFDSTDYDVPFIPVDTDQHVTFGQLADWFDQFNTNEQQQVATDSDGTGQDEFQVLTKTEAPGLGCGEIESNGTTRNCWLVIVPRGQYEPNGFQNTGTTTTRFTGPLDQGPLAASNWAQRIQIHLNFTPIQQPCPIGSANERETVGTELAARAVFSWQLALNKAADCKTIYGYSQAPEATDTTQLSDPTGAGLAFTTIPIGSEAVRINGGGSPPPTPPLVYAPVAASALTIGWNVNLSAPAAGKISGTITTPIKLTPRLIAKLLTQSYEADQVNRFSPAAAWALHNPQTILSDPEFEALNPEIPITIASGNPVALFDTEDHSAVNQQLWQWILADPAARAWLSGTPDENGMVINPAWQALKLATTGPLDSFPRADGTCDDQGLAPGLTPPKEIVKCPLDLLPYVNGYDDAASKVRSGTVLAAGEWDNSAIAPDGTPGWFDKSTPEVAGLTAEGGLVDTASLANYGLVPTELCGASGSNCVLPSTASVGAALATAKPDSSGLMQVNPAKVGSGGYPLVDVTYAAVRTDQSAAALTDYAHLIQFAAGPGQTAGTAPGDLPRGYLPLPAKLKAQAQQAAATLLADAHPSTGPTGPQPAGNTGGTRPTHHPGTGPTHQPGGPTRHPRSGPTRQPGGGRPHHPGSPTHQPGTSGSGPGGEPVVPNPVGTTPAGTPTPAPTTSPTPGAAGSTGGAGGGPSGAQPSSTPTVQLAAGVTPAQSAGGVRWALLAIAIAGLVGAVATSVNRIGGLNRIALLLPRWRSR